MSYSLKTPGHLDNRFLTEAEYKMRDKDKTKKQLIDELAELRQRIAELDKSENKLKQSNEALRKSEERFRNLFETMAEGVVMIDVNGHIVQANSAAERILGLSRSEIESRNYVGPEWEILRPDGMPMPKEEMAGPRAMKEKRRIEDIVMGVKCPNGTVSWIAVSATPFVGKDGRAEGVVGTFTDITELRKTEKKIKENQQMLEASKKELKKFSHKILSIREEEKKNLSTILHHEVGSLAMVLNSGFASIEERIKNNNLEEALEITTKNKSTLKKFVSMLKKISVDLRPPNLEIIGLPDVLREYFLETAEIEKIKINFCENIDKKRINDKMAIVVFRIVQEAFNNIIKHANANRVKVALYYRRNKINLDIYDDGIGFNTKKSLKTTKVNLGIRGMKEMAESLDGKFNIKSASGEGTEINITLPIIE